MAILGSIIANLGMNTANFKAGVKTATTQLERFSHTAKRKFREINKSAGVTAERIGAIGAVGFGALVKNAIDSADQMEKINRRLGISTEALSQLKFAAEQSGIAFNQLTMGMQRMQRRVAEAAQGTGEAKDALIELGLSAQQLNKMSLDQQLLAVADAMQGLEESGDKTRLAMKLFDSEGVALLQMFEEGKIGIQELMTEADKLGLTLNNKTAKGAAAANDAMNRAKAAMQGAALQAAENTAPAIEHMGNVLSQTIPAAVTTAVEAFYVLQREGLKVLSFIVHKYGEMMDSLRTLAIVGGFDELAKTFQESSEFAQMFAQNLLKSSGEAEKVLDSIAKSKHEVGEMVANPAAEATAAVQTMTEGLAKAQQEAAQLGETMSVDLFESSKNAFEQIQDQFKQTLKNMINEWISSGIRDLFKNLGFFSGKGGFFKSLFPGFATGGSFTVGGRGGTDNNLVAFRASRGEQVTVSTPAQQAAMSGAGGIIFNNSYDFSGSTLSEPEVRQMIEQSQRVTEQNIQNKMIRGRF